MLFKVTTRAFDVFLFSFFLLWDQRSKHQYPDFMGVNINAIESCTVVELVPYTTLPIVFCSIQYLAKIRIKNDTYQNSHWCAHKSLNKAQVTNKEKTVIEMQRHQLEYSLYQVVYIWTSAANCLSDKDIYLPLVEPFYNV